ncbi:MAG: YihY/virulence factor BrkB family protein [Dehalococcoidia bacterium]|nr:YihY/virulence factor BrkB family protein [Dehalococcoidia bacterium]
MSQARVTPAVSPDRNRRAPRYWLAVVARVTGRAIKNYAEDRGNQMAAAISYYTLFSLVPVFILIVAIFGLVLRDAELQLRVIDALVEALPLPEGDVADVVNGAADLAPTFALLSFVGALWTSGALSAALRTSLNVAFEARRSRPAVRGKLIDYTLLPILGIPVLGGLVLSAGFQIIQQRTDNLPLAARFEWVWAWATLSGALALTFIAFSLLYWLAPNRTVRFRYIWPGALFAALAFEALKYGFTFYLANFGNYDVVYGALGGVVVLLFWVFLSANILILGAEVANELPHVLLEEPRHGRVRESSEERHWISAGWKLVRWLLLAPEDEEDHMPPGDWRNRDNGHADNGTHIDRTRRVSRAKRRAEQAAADPAPAEEEPSEVSPS